MRRAACSWARATRRRACSRSSATPGSRGARGSARRASTSTRSARAASARRRARSRRSRIASRPARPPPGAATKARPRRSGGSIRGTPSSAFVGKLIVSKGVDLLLAAWPLVHERFPEATLLVVGFGAYRDGLDAARPRSGRGRPRGGRRDRGGRARARGWPAGGAPLPPRASWTASPARSAAPIWRARRARWIKSATPGGSSTRTSATCCRPAPRRRCRAPSPRPSGWWRQRRPAAGCSPSRRRTPAWPR